MEPQKIKITLVLVLLFFIGLAKCITHAKSSETVDIDNSKTETTSIKKEKNKSYNQSVSSPTENAFGKLRSHSLGLGLGQTILLGEMSEFGEDKMTFDLFYSYKASYSFDFFADAHHSKHTFQDKFTSITALAFSIKGKFFQFDSFSPFALAGLGVYYPKTKRSINNTLVESSGKWTFGTNLGVGVDLTLNDHVTFGILGQYHNPFDIKQDIGSEIEGSYFKLMVTTMYSI